jgi:hypothetical protein
MAKSTVPPGLDRRIGPSFGAARPRVLASIQAPLPRALTKVGRRTAIRAAIVNHRTTEQEVDLLIDSVLSLGRHAQQLWAA